MKKVITRIESTSPYSQSRNYTREAPKEEKEGHDVYEERTWRYRCHANNEGYIFIPPMAFKNCLTDVAQYLGVQIPGKGKATYTKHFRSGILIVDPLVLDVKRDEVQGMPLYVPSNGQRGGAKRVWKTFPVIPEWSGDVEFMILDETITEDVFLYHLEQAGGFIGIGYFRPQNNGYWGRFQVADLKWDV